jgi:phosphoesterase RecJ-like protein
MAAILQVLRQGERFLVCSHTRPDGDAVGSMLAMGMLLEQMGKHADLVTADRIPAVYNALPGAGAVRCAACVQGSYDAVILLECDGLERARVRGLEKFFLINIDHHISGSHFAQLNWVDCQAASVGELVYRLVKAAGADPVRIAQEVYHSTSTSKMLLLGLALSNLKREGRLAWLWVTHHDMVRACAAEEDCEGIVNYAVCIRGVEAAAFLRELPEGSIRLSLRSKGKVNVAAIAERLGGGGHENAAGCTLEGPLHRAQEEILGELRRSVASFHSNAA